ncbi:MAG: hypothetical protein AAF518_11430 [Spirochaetota bacterium]
MEEQEKKSLLLENLDGDVSFAVNQLESVDESIKFYFTLDTEGDYSQVLQEEIKSIFADKITNKAYFHTGAKEWKLKALGFNQILHILLRKLWEQEGFESIAKNPSKIAFLDNNQELKDARVSQRDAERYISNLRILPFITPYPDFFKMNPQDRIRKARAWVVNNDGKIRFCIDRIRLIGAYIQTLALAGAHLVELASEYEKTGPASLGVEMQLEEKVKDMGKVTEERAEMFTNVILALREVKESYLIFTGPVLRRSLITNYSHLLQKDAKLREYIDFFSKARNRNKKMSEERMLSCSKRAFREYHRQAFQEEVDTSSSEWAENIDYVFIIDMILHMLRIISQATVPEALQENLNGLTTYVQSMVPEIEERHIKLSYILYQETQKRPDVEVGEKEENLFKDLQKKLYVPEKDIRLIYLLLQSDHAPSLSLPLATFIENCIAEDEKGILNETHVKVLRSLFVSLPEGIKARQFYTIKERVKARFNDGRKKLVDAMTHFIEQKIREHRLAYVSSFLPTQNTASIAASDIDPG